MFGGEEDTRRDFVEKAAEARRQRQAQREDEARLQQENAAAVKVQALARGFVFRQRCKKLRREKFDAIFGTGGFGAEDLSPEARALSGRDIHSLIASLLRFYNAETPEPNKDDVARTARLTRAVLSGITSNPATSYVGLALQPDMAMAWVKQQKLFLHMLVKTLASAGSRQAPLVSLLLNALLTLTESRTWNLVAGSDADSQKKQMGLTFLCTNITNHLVANGLFADLSRVLNAMLCQRSPQPSSSALGAAVTLCLRPLMFNKFKEELVTVFVLQILPVPTLMHWVQKLCAPVAGILRAEVATRALRTLGQSPQSIKIATRSLEGNGAICLLGNLISLIQLDDASFGAQEQLLYFQIVVGLLDYCRQYVVRKKTNISTEHPIFGLFSGNTPGNLIAVMPTVVEQLRALWSRKYVGLWFADVLAMPAVEAQAVQEYARVAPAPKSGFASIRWRKKSKDSFVPSKPLTNVTAQQASQVVSVCSLYNTMAQTLRSSRSEVLGVLSFRKGLVPRLWTCLFGFHGNGRESVLKFANNLDAAPCAPLLELAAETTCGLVTVLEDKEIFELQDPMPVKLLLDISHFLNSLLFRAIWHAAPDAKGSPLSGNSDHSRILCSVARLLGALYDLDCRRQYAPPDHWVIEALTQKEFDAQLDEERAARRAGRPVPYERGQYILANAPHVVPFLVRVRLFRDEVLRDRTQSEGQKHYVTVRRDSVLADGFRELSRLSPTAFKGVIKVKYVNQLGVEEAGIDEQGVFKEFLEDTIRSAFDPDFGLFATTPNQQLYPSPMSYIQEQHLQLFEFVGRMLGKACYEGIVVDVPFAHFFLNALVGRSNTFDELASLDPDLAKNLSFVKNYDGDADDLALVFAVDEDRFGTMQTVSLRPGGAALPVTNENKLLYVLLMADYKLNQQFKTQTNAFLSGFFSVVPRLWLRHFSAPEAQRLISGDNVKLDVDDLKSHVNYLGGFHASHRVIKWLWECVNEFSQEDQAAFLKFVTSCSKPPILGFSALRPVFSVRAVQEGESEDGYTLGRAVVNFFARGTDTARLPTSSTCFNLLKLPIYKTKRVLKEKLTYAIRAKAGFELS